MKKAITINSETTINLIKKKNHSILKIEKNLEGAKFYLIPKGLKLQKNKNKIKIKKEKLEKTDNFFFESLKEFLDKKKKKVSKILELSGTGYGIKKDKNKNVLIFKLGDSHYHILNLNNYNPNITINIKSNKIIELLGPDKTILGNFATKIKKLKKSDPYKGKGF